MPLGEGGGEEEWNGAGGQVRLPDIDTRRLSGLKYKLICRFKLAVYMVGSGIITNNNNNNNNNNRNTLIHLNVNDPPKKKSLNTSCRSHS